MSFHTPIVFLADVLGYPDGISALNNGSDYTRPGVQIKDFNSQVLALDDQAAILKVVGIRPRFPDNTPQRHRASDRLPRCAEKVNPVVSALAPGRSVVSGSGRIVADPQAGRGSEFCSVHCAK